MKTESKPNKPAKQANYDFILYFIQYLLLREEMVKNKNYFEKNLLENMSLYYSRSGNMNHVLI